MKLALYTDSVEQLPLERALDVAVEAGVTGVELGVGGQSQGRHLDLRRLAGDSGERARLRAQLDERGLEIVALNCSAWPLHPTLGSAHEDLTRTTMRLAGELGVETVVTMSGCPGDGPGATTIDWITYPWPPDAVALRERQWEAVIEFWRATAALAAEHGVRRLAFELHPLHLAYNVPTLLRLRDAVGPIAGVNLDPSHLFWQDADPVAAAEALTGAVHHVHLKDTRSVPEEIALAGSLDGRAFEDPHRRAWNFCTVGRGHGEVFWRRFLLALSAAGYDGALSIENEDPLQEPIEGVVEAAEFIRPLLPPPGGDRFARSRSQHARASMALARGVATAFRAAQQPVPITFVEGRGARLRDIDGNRYIDYALAFGPMLLGHSPESVLSAVRDQLTAGIGYGASHPLEAKLAEAICRTIPGAERVIVSNTGSEAVHVALRLARAATGRVKIVKFAGHYDGWLDPVHVGTPGVACDAPGTTGQDPAAAANTIVCPWNDLDALEAILAGGDVAAVIMEPLAVNAGCIAPLPGYLESVRAATQRSGTVLVFDEVITGYRLALGGAQERFAVTADLVVLGKALGGGFPISAVCGSAALFDDVSSGRMAHVGTFNANPVCAAAATAAILALERDGDAIYPALARHAEHLAAILNEEGEAAGLPLAARCDVGVAHGFVSERPVVTAEDAAGSDAAAYRVFAAALLRHGVHVIPRGLLYVSTCHGDEDLAATRTAVGHAARETAAWRSERR